MEITAEAASKCINCHLQKSGTKDIPHVSSTDHWIRKNPSKENKNGHNPRFAPFAGKSFTPREKADALLAVSESKADSTTLRELKNFVQYLLPENKLKYNYLFHQELKLQKDTQAFVNPKNPWTKFYWAEVKKRSSLPYLSTLQQACDAAPSMVEFQYRLALAKEEAGQNETYSNVLVLNPNHAKSLSNLGFRSLQAHDYAKAAELLKRALQQSPNFTLAQENLARCYLEEGKFEDCRKILKRVIVKYPSEQRYQQALSSIP
jgi:tetratricopeptide (TPR) repeat protein